MVKTSPSSGIPALLWYSSVDARGHLSLGGSSHLSAPLWGLCEIVRSFDRILDFESGIYPASHETASFFIDSSDGSIANNIKFLD